MVCHRGLGECYGCGPPCCVKPAPLPKPHHFRKMCKDRLKKRFPKKCELDECDMCCPPITCNDKCGRKPLVGCKSKLSKCGDACCVGCCGDCSFGCAPQDCCFGNACCPGKCKAKFIDCQCGSPAFGYCPYQGRYGCGGNCWRGVY
uniref:Keratin-associated protein n=1 Tax=Nilaparvata lugens TaxID=108931 RepID=A0A220XIK3_NILLU|nr:keratin-associated protein [Nilaparvata lugens]